MPNNNMSDILNNIRSITTSLDLTNLYIYIFQVQFIKQLIDLFNEVAAYFGFADKQKLVDSFHQQLLERNYDEALRLAKKNKFLDIDLVYKCKWMNTAITKNSIKNTLALVKDKLWAISESAQTVPVTYETCDALLDFGLDNATLKLLYELGDESNVGEDNQSTKSKAKVDNSYKLRKVKLKRQSLLPENISDEQIVGLIDFNNLNEYQSDLTKYRKDLLIFKKALLVYGSILGNYKTILQHFDHVFYDEFRRKSVLNNCIDYAHNGDAHAIEVLLEYYPDQLMAHYLPILSNFPETLSPNKYKTLLPFTSANKPIFSWKPELRTQDSDESDWSDFWTPKLSSFVITRQEIIETYQNLLYTQSPQLKKYNAPMTSEILQEWYLSRAIQLEFEPAWPSNAIQLLKLGIELGIENLKGSYDDMNEFDKVLYDCCTEDNIYITFKEFEQMPMIDKLLLMTGDSLKDCKNKFRFYVVPFLYRRDKELGHEGKSNILRDYFIRLAHTRELICREVYNHLVDKKETDNFIAKWTYDIDVIDQIGGEVKKIEKERQIKALSGLAGKTMEMGAYDECYEACQLIIMKDFRECWTLCCHLGMCKEFKNFEAKYKLLAFALAHCEDSDGSLSFKIIDYVIDLRKRDVKLQLAYLRQNEAS